MKKNRARKTMLEVARRVHLSQHGSLKGFGETAKFYRRDWKVNGCSYKEAMEFEALKELMKSVGMR